MRLRRLVVEVGLDDRPVSRLVSGTPPTGLAARGAVLVVGLGRAAGDHRRPRRGRSGAGASDGERIQTAATTRR